MQTYYLIMIDNFKFIVHKENSQLSVTQEHEGKISNIVAIFKADNNSKYWAKMENFKENIIEIIYKNSSFTEQGSYKNKINNFLNNN